MQKTKIVKKITAQRDRLKTLAVRYAAEEYNVTTAYVYGCIRGDFKDGQADVIKQTFSKKYEALKQVLA